MDPPQHLQLTVIRRLQSDTEPVDPGCSPDTQLILSHCTWVYFHGHLNVPANVKVSVQCVKNAGGVIPVQNRWSSPAHKNRAHTIFTVILFHTPDLPDERIYIG